MKILKKRLLFSVAGLVFGLTAGFWAVLVSGGGHFNLPIVLFISPFWFGLLLWPLWSFLAVRFDSTLSKVLFVLTMLAHFVGIALYVRDAGHSDAYQFRHATMYDSTFILIAAPAFILYVAAQFFLWLRFVRDHLMNQAQKSISSSAGAT